MFRSKIVISSQIFLILCTFFICGACSIILNKKEHKVTIKAADPEAIVYLDGVSIGAGPTISTKINRSKMAHIIKVEKAGFETQNLVIMPAKSTAATKLSMFLVLPFFVEGYSEKLYNFPKVIATEPMIATAYDRNEERKDLVVSQVNLDSDEINKSVYSIKYKKYLKKKSPKKKKIQNSLYELHTKFNATAPETYWIGLLNDKLAKSGYLDSNFILKSRQNILQLEVTLLDQQIDMISRSYIEDASKLSFLRVTNTYLWKVKNFSNTEIYSKTLTVVSGNYATHGGLHYSKGCDAGKGYLEAAEDCLKQSMNTFLNSAELDSLRKLQNFVNSDRKLQKISVSQNNVSIGLSELNDCIVSVNTKGNHCSGAFIGDDGEILTSSKITESGEDIYVKFRKDSLPAKVLYSDLELNIAILKVEGAPQHKVLNLKDFRESKHAETIYASGIAIVDANMMTISKGIVSSKRVVDGVEVIQVSSKLSSGYLGGPLVSEDGIPLGILNFMISGKNIEGLSFATPITYLRELIIVE